MHLSSRVYRKFRLLVAATLVISALAVSPALAKGRMRATGFEQCWTAPDPASRATDPLVYFKGSGFNPGMGLAIAVAGRWYMGGSDSDGKLSTYDFTLRFSPGTYAVAVYYAGDTHMTVLAQCSLTVVN